MQVITEVFFVLLLTGWIAGWLMLTRIRTIQTLHSSEIKTKVSVIIPARNEAYNLPTLLKSLNNQNPGPDEVIVADDHSTDGTGDIAQKLGAKVVKVPPLEKGWTGKTWALRHATLSAQFETLLLLDADTWLHQGALQTIISTWDKTKKPAVVSILPYHETKSLYEGLSLFFNILMAAGAGGFGAFGKAKLFGQSLVIKKSDFLRLGSDKDVSGQVLENFSMSQKLEQEGFSILCFSGKGNLSFRMFPNGVKALVEGWAKAFAHGAAGTTLPVLLTTILWMIGIGSAGVMVALFLALNTMLIPFSLVGISYALFLIQIGFFASRLGKFPLWSYLLFPLTFIAYQIIFLKSVFVASGLAKANWRGRELQ